MTNNDILTLAKAGFTATQIAALSTVTQTTSSAQTPPAQQTQTVQTAPPAHTSEDFNASILNELQKLTGTIQANAVLGTQISGQTRTTDDILAEIINPPEYMGNTGGVNNGK